MYVCLYILKQTRYILYVVLALLGLVESERGERGERASVWGGAYGAEEGRDSQGGKLEERERKRERRRGEGGGGEEGRQAGRDYGYASEVRARSAKKF